LLFTVNIVLINDKYDNASFTLVVIYAYVLRVWFLMSHCLSYITTSEFSNLACTAVVSYYDYENFVSVRFGLYHEVDVYYQILPFKYRGMQKQVHIYTLYNSYNCIPTFAPLCILISSNINPVISTVCIFFLFPCLCYRLIRYSSISFRVYQYLCFFCNFSCLMVHHIMGVP